MLQARGAHIRAYDPQGRPKADGLLSGVEWCDSALEAAEGADILVMLTEWNEFRALDLSRVREVMAGNVLVDLRNMYPEALAEEAGFIYYGVGRTLPPPVSRKHNRRRELATESQGIREANQS